MGRCDFWLMVNLAVLKNKRELQESLPLQKTKHRQKQKKRYFLDDSTHIGALYSKCGRMKCTAATGQ